MVLKGVSFQAVPGKNVGTVWELGGQLWVANGRNSVRKISVVLDGTTEGGGKENAMDVGTNAKD